VQHISKYPLVLIPLTSTTDKQLLFHLISIAKKKSTDLLKLRAYLRFIFLGDRIGVFATS